MKRLPKKWILFLFFITLTSFGVHKFYVAIYQLNYVKEKKTIQITARLFIDDINEAVSKRYATKTHLASDQETPNDVELLKKYIAEKCIIKVNGQSKPLFFHSKETEDNVLLCYFSIKEVKSIKTLEIENSIIMEQHPEQQNIIQAKFNDKKQNLLLTSESYKGMLK